MLEVLSQGTGALPAEILQRTSRFWFRTPTIALGLVDASEPGAASYWKWNTENDRWRQTAINEDRRLFGPESPPLGQAIALLSYKPESRLVMVTEHEGGEVIAKRYAPARFGRAVATAVIFTTTFESSTPQLLAMDRSASTIFWSRAAGRSPAASEANPMLAIALSGTSAAEFTPPIEVPRLTPGAIAAHVRGRVGAARAWISRLGLPDAVFDSEWEARTSEVVARLQGMPPTQAPRLIHGDFRPRNVLLSGVDAPILVDSDHLAFGDHEWDLAAWAADMESSGRGAASEAMETFGALHGVDRERLALYLETWSILQGIAAIEERARR